MSTFQNNWNLSKISYMAPDIFQAVNEDPEKQI